MASGVTECVMTGEVTELRDFIGRTLLKNGEDSDVFMEGGKWRYKKKVPSESFWKKRLKEEQDRLAWLNSATNEDLANAANAAYLKAGQNAADRTEHDQEKIKIRQRYEAMMAQLKEWQTKLPHEGLLAFSRGLMDQLDQSLKNDCGKRVAKPDQPALQSPSEYKAAEIKICQDMIRHYEESVARDTQAANSDNELHNRLCQYLNDDLTGDFASLPRSVDGPCCPEAC